MRRFYQCYQIQQTVSVKLSWSHYCELLTISDADKRSFYEKETVNSGWSVHELKRQISTSLYEKLLLSEGKANKETVLDIIKDPYVFEFLGVPENKPMLESDLEKALVAQIEKFLLELGRGFMFVGTQQRITLNNTHYYVDMVFYNKILQAYVLIELKTTKLTPEAAGQLNMYLKSYIVFRLFASSIATPLITACQLLASMFPYNNTVNINLPSFPSIFITPPAFSTVSLILFNPNP